MFFNSLKTKLKKSYSTLNKELQPKVFPKGEPEYIYVGTVLNVLFKKRDVFKLIQIYASVYTYYKLEMGNSYTTFIYTQKKAAGLLSAYECKTMIALVMLNTTSNKSAISDPIAQVEVYRNFVQEYIDTVEGIKKNPGRFETKRISAGEMDSPILVAGITGVHKYIKALKVPGVESIAFGRTSALHLTDTRCNVSYSIDEYTLINDDTEEEIAKLWFNIYGTENTAVLPVCFSDKTPFSAETVAPKLFAEGVSQWQSVEKICQDAHVTYDHKKLVISTLAYFFVTWTFGFGSLRMGQAMKLEEGYMEEFSQYNKKAFEGFPERQILDNEQMLKDMLKRVDERVRESFHNNNQTLVDDGLTDEYIFEFISNVESVPKIKDQIVEKLMIEWKKLGKKADETYLT